MIKHVKNDKGTSSLCPVCWEKLSPNECRRLKCGKCGLEEDRI
ncbi:MAG: hypothetical protein DSN99_04665 [Archaeoglobi archaeon]|nr:MAG: hypothetical protein DSN99_04665 [Archaeoglobi archaeon]